MKRVKSVRRSAACVLALVLAGCAATGPPLVDFAELRNVRESGHEHTGEWEHTANGLVNALPAGVPPEHIQTGEGGAGVSMALVDGFQARDLVIEALVEFEAGAAPGLLYRVRESGGVVTSMFMAVLNVDGAHLWRFQDGEWIRVYTDVRPMQPEQTYHLRVATDGAEMSVYVNGERLFTAQHPSLLHTGGAGISAREGVCRFNDLRAASRD